MKRASDILTFSLQVCALKVTDGARRRILKSGGTIMTFDQLALTAPKGQGTVLLSGEYLQRVCNWYLGLGPALGQIHTSKVNRKLLAVVLFKCIAAFNNPTPFRMQMMLNLVRA